MKNSFIPVLSLSAFLTLTLTPGLGLHGTAYAAAQESTDAALAAKVKASIDATPEGKGAEVTVTAASGGVVTLSGTAASPVARVKIFEAAKATEGVTKVVNKIKLGK